MNIPFLDFSGMHAGLQHEMIGACQDVIESNWFVNGAQVAALESEWAEYCGVPFASGVSNGLDALILSLRALGIGPSHEVIVPSNTYIATALAVTHVGARPIFVEPSEVTFNITAEKIRGALSSKTKCIIPVHLYGQAAEMGPIMTLARKHGLYVVEDNAQAQGAEYMGQKTGSFGDCNATSFYPGKNLGALGDAGAVTSHNGKIMSQVATLKNYGSQKKYFNKVLGYNNRLDEIQAAILRVKLKELDSWTQERRRIAKEYGKLLSGTGDLILPESTPHCSHVFHLFVVRTALRDSLAEYMKEKGIGTLIHYPVPPHLQECYGFLGHNAGSFPVAERMAETCLSLPLYPGLNNETIQYISEVIKAFFNGS